LIKPYFSLENLKILLYKEAIQNKYHPPWPWVDLDEAAAIISPGFDVILPQ
jgi:hypothetical protein